MHRNGKGNCADIQKEQKFVKTLDFFDFGRYNSDKGTTVRKCVVKKNINSESEVKKEIELSGYTPICSEVFRSDFRCGPDGNFADCVNLTY